MGKAFEFLAWFALFAVAGILWGSLGGLFIYHEWTWPWEAHIAQRFFGAAWLLISCPFLAFATTDYRRPTR